MNNVKEMIENFDYIWVEVVDAWQFPAVYILYKKDVVIDNLKEEYFIKEIDENQYCEVKELLKEIKLEDWYDDYLPERNEKIEDTITWKVMISQNGKKMVKKGKNKWPEEFTRLEDYMISETYREDEV